MRQTGELRRCAAPALAAAVALTLVAGSLLGAPPLSARPMTPEDVARLQEVESVAVAPDGGAVACRLRVQRVPFEDPDGKPWSELWVVEDDGPPRPFVTGTVNVGSVTWTPDGDAISFLAERGEDEKDALYVIPRRGGEARRVLGHPSGIDTYAWSPEGDRVAFVAAEEPPEAMDELEEAGFDAVVYEEDEPLSRVWIGRPESDEPPRRLSLPGYAHEVRWCPGGDRLAVTLAPNPTVDASYMFTRIKIVDAASGEIVTAVDNPGKLGAIVWSPDCSSLAFVSGADIHDPAEGRLMVASAEDGTFRDVVPGYPGHVVDARWLDAETLVFLGDEGLSSALYTIGRDGEGKAAVLEADGTVWTDLDLAASGSPRRLGLVGESPRHPAELFTAAVGGTAPATPERRTDSNPWLADVDLAPQEGIAYTARDGVEIQAVLVRPLGGAREGSDRDEAGGAPLIVYVHGGPESHVRNGWVTSYSRPGQVAAAEGYAVLYPNYRGSTGRGLEFSLLSQGKPAEGEFDDLVDGVDHLVETGLADRDRVGITGGSYGGYASAWGATYYSERFAAAVMFVGISDKVSKAGTSDIPEELYLVHARMRPWEDWQHFLEASPIYHVEKARTPILILGGEDDTRVDPGQSLELYRHLKTLDQAPVRLVRYPGEGHGNRRAASRYDYHLRMLRWFDHYLRGPGGEPPSWRLDYPLREEAADGQPEPVE